MNPQSEMVCCSAPCRLEGCSSALMHRCDMIVGDMLSLIPLARLEPATPSLEG